jgi:MOSC domain-containing protein YiiM
VKLVSLNVARPRLVFYKGKSINTGIFKQPLSGPMQLRTKNLDGVHGAPHKAVYGYPSEHYSFWREELPGVDLPWGMFGENFTTSGLGKTNFMLGIVFRLVHRS